MKGRQPASSKKQKTRGQKQEARKKSCLLPLTFCLFFFSLLSPDVFAETGFKKDQPIEITADFLTYEKAKDTYYAEGNVIAVSGKTSIRADRMTVDMAASHATATGNVEVIDEDGNTLKGDSLELNIDTKVGVVINGRLFFKMENVHVKGEEIKKTGEVSYSAHNGLFTTCDCEEGESPAWGFYSTNADITFGEYLTSWNTLFYIKDVPVFYFPYLRFPVKRERETGFLSPKVGFSRLRGFKFDNSFFWAISDSTDATFYLDIETSRGLGKGIEYRYVLSKSSDGEFYFYHFKEKDIDRVREFRKGSNNLSRPKTAEDDRWLLKYRHNGFLPGDVIFKANVNRVSDDEYFIDFGKDVTERSLDSLESNISMTKTWQKFNLVTQFRYFDNLLVEDNNATLQRLPEITLTGIDQQILDTPFHFSMESSFVNFARKEGSAGQRADAHPAISLPLNPGGYFEFRPAAGIRETLYWVGDNPPQDRFHDRTTYDLSADITTTFVRILTSDEDMETEGLKKVKHSIRPKVLYTYMPEQVQDDLPVWDGVDRIGQRNDVTYSLNSILTGKFMEGAKPYYHDYIYLDLSQSYNINEATRKLVSPTDERRPFSDTTGELRVKPVQWTAITAKGRYDTYEGWMEEYDTSLGVWDKRGDRLDISYRYIRTEIKRSPLEYLDVSMRLKIIQSTDLTYRNRYSYNDKQTIEAVYGLEYRHQCWGTQLTYTERPEERIVFVSFNLLGIGEVGGLTERVE